MSILGAVIVSEKITLVEGELNADGTVTLIKEENLDLGKDQRHQAYVSMHKRVSDRMLHGVTKVVLKASSAGPFNGGQAALLAAELRGVFLAAIPSHIEVVQHHMKTLSKAGSRKVGDYTKDDEWWNQHFSGEIKKGSREAAYLILKSGE